MNRQRRPIRSNRVAIPMACIGLLSVTLLAADDAQRHTFERSVRPLLVQHCYECHSEKSGKRKGGLLLDTREGWQLGGDSGPALMPGAPEESLLIQAIRYTDPDLEMPPNGKLTNAEIATLENWVAQGAFDPRQGSTTAQAETIDINKERDFWAFQPPVPPSVPSVGDASWPNNDIDRFALAQMEAAGLHPVAPAQDTDLLRRLYYDLTGLPPTEAELQTALSLPAATRISDTVDRLLASRQFGETWGRHWLDLARYSESTGGGRSALLPDAWRYRNYVIDAFNEDKPYNQFVREQIAGDLLPAENDRQRAEQLIATAFLVMGPKNLDLQDKELLRMNTVDEQIDTVGRVFMGLTISCARCHDHKFDPIPATDYYALAGIFRSTRTLKRSNVSTLTKRDLPTSPEHRLAVKEYTTAKTKLDKQLSQAKKAKKKTAEQQTQIKELEQQVKALVSQAPAPIPQTLAVIDETETADYNLCIRGNVHQLGPSVPRGFVQVASPPNQSPPKIPKGESGRREFAEWLASPSNPLVARVMVNRIWHHLFGDGLVRSVDNFGHQGERPTHPELLDYLASEFVHNGWSAKQLIRQIVLSKTYQLSSERSASNQQIDPDNRFRWRMPRRRLTAEAIRDSILSISGTLTQSHVECLFPKQAQNDTALQKASLDVPTLVNPPYRSVYIPVLREEGLNPLLRAFDFANPSFTVGSRNRSTLPTQALYLMNSPFVMEEAQRAAEKLLSENPQVPQDQLLTRAYRQTLGREPGPEERAAAERFFTSQKTQASPQAQWAHLYHSLFASVDFRFLK